MVSKVLIYLFINEMNIKLNIVIYKLNCLLKRGYSVFLMIFVFLILLLKNFFGKSFIVM